MITDPDAVIQDLLNLADDLAESRVPLLTIDEAAEKGHEMAAKFTELDEWMMRGGIPPARWNRGVITT